MIDISRPAGSGSVGQGAGRSGFSVAIATDVGRVRRNNEDYVHAERIVRDTRRYSMWAVADGVGGGPQGERASRTAVDTVVDYLVARALDRSNCRADRGVCPRQSQRLRDHR